MVTDDPIAPQTRVRHVRTGWEGIVQRVMRGHRSVLYLVSWRSSRSLEYSACRPDELEVIEDPTPEG